MLPPEPLATPPPAGAAARARPFRLTRYFSTVSLVGITLVTVCLIGAYRELTLRHLIVHEGRANAGQTQAFANAVWDRYAGFITASGGRSRQELLADPAQASLGAEVRARMKGLPIAKVKIYNLQGLTVYSTDEKQIGEDKSNNAGFRQARGGRVSSDITYRDKFDAFEGTLSQRNLIFSYVPVHAAAGDEVLGVLEVYSDVTELLQAQSRAQWEVAAVALLLLGTLYLFLLFVVRKADAIIGAQERERAAKEAEVRHQAYHDALTGLPNRAYFAERLNETLGLARRHGHTGALMFIDLDRFKIVNDSLGHQAGDLLLQEASRRINSCLRGSDLLFRMGGDEFTVILPEIHLPEDAATVARRITEAVARPVHIHEHELVVGATVGIAVYPGDGDSAEELLKNADAAMYNAKEGGRGRHSFYRAEMNLRALQRMDMEMDLQRAFREGEFGLYYQPRLQAGSRQVVALEALLRWLSPARGVVAAADFIAALEANGMIPIVGEWVLRSACTQVRQWQQQGRPPLRVSVNVSRPQFQSPGFVAMVQRVLQQTGAPPELIELEFSEATLIAEPEQAVARFKAIRALGVRLSVDDFANGYSSLNYLRHMQADFIKINRSFVSGIPCNARDRAVARAITELARGLDIGVVATGVETEAQAAFFSTIDGAELQGYLLARPMPEHELIDYLDHGAAALGGNKLVVPA